MPYSYFSSRAPYPPPEESADCTGCVWEDQCLQTLRCENYTLAEDMTEEEYKAELFLQDGEYEAMVAEFDDTR